MSFRHCKFSHNWTTILPKISCYALTSCKADKDNQ